MSYYRYFGNMAVSHLVSDEMVDQFFKEFEELFGFGLQEVENRSGEQFLWLQDQTYMRRLYLRNCMTHHHPILEGGEEITTLELTVQQLELLNQVRTWPIGAYGKEGE